MKREILGNTNLRESWWPKVRAGLLKNFKSDDSEQQRNTVTYLRSLSSHKPFRMKAEEVERYIRTYQQMANTLVSQKRLTAFDQMICFLQGLPDNTATKKFEDMMFDVNEPATFSANGGFSGAVTIALTMMRKKADVSKRQELKKFPALKGAAHVPATSGEKAQKDHLKKHTHLIANRLMRGNDRVLVDKHLHACASPMVMGKLEGAKRVKMLIDSCSEMCVMSKRLWDELQDKLPIDRDVTWSIGSANATRDRVYGVCHSVSVNVRGVEVDVPIFVLEVAAQNLILGRPWERKVRAQYNNRDDGSLYITILTLDDQRRVVFCAIGKSDERNRDRARIQGQVTSATLENDEKVNERQREGEVLGNNAGSQMRETAR